MSGLIPVSQALDAIFALVSPTDTEEVRLEIAHGRVLARPMQATRAQPPFASSAMDGYAVRFTDAVAGATLLLVGESAAGHGFDGIVGSGEAARIFTGAPVPEGADRVVIQENTTRDGDLVTLTDVPDDGGNIRIAGSDFNIGDAVEAPRRLNARDLALLASMNLPAVPVHRKPIVAVIATGDELVMPGEAPSPNQIIASNSFGLKAICEAEGADVRLLPIARDDPASLTTVLGLAEGADLIVTIGGASVGDHDIVAQVAGELGLERSFYKVAMRPGKPLMSGRIGDSTLIGLPGNPVSSMVCAHIFIVPALRAMQGLPARARVRHQAFLFRPVSQNGPREHYMRASVTITDGQSLIAANSRQDSSLLTVLAEANCLMIRPPNDPARGAGDVIDYLPL